MTTLAWMMARAGGWPRTVLIAGSTAVTSGLLLAALAVLNLPYYPKEYLVSLVEETGSRGVVASVFVLLTMPVLLLMYQAIRLGTATRERRFAALRVAGATPDQVRRLGALEVGIPAFGGSVLGIGVYGGLRVVLGGDPYGSIPPRQLRNTYSTTLTDLVPVSVTPTWWQILLVIAGVGLTGCYVGWRVSRRVVLMPWGVARGQPARPPRPWGLVALAASPIVAAWWVANPTPVPRGAMGEWSPPASEALPGIIAVALALLGTMSLASWSAYRIGRVAARRTGSAVTLMAARRLVTDPRPAGRAAAAVAGITLVAGGAGSAALWVVGLDPRPWTPASIAVLLLTTLVLTSPLVAVVFSLAVHSVEALLDRRRAVAALSAAGMPVAMLQRAQTRVAVLSSLPLAAAGVVLGTLCVGAFAALVGRPRLPDDLRVLLGIALNWVLVLVLVWLAALVATRSVRRWLVRTADPSNLRTE